MSPPNSSFSGVEHLQPVPAIMGGGHSQELEGPVTPVQFSFDGLPLTHDGFGELLNRCFLMSAGKVFASLGLVQDEACW